MIYPKRIVVLNPKDGFDSLGKKHAKEIGLSTCEGYYNAGVILFDLQKWKELDCTTCLLELNKKNSAKP